MKSIALALAALVTATIAQDAGALTLRRAVTVGTEVVTVDDFFSDAGSHAGTALFRAPEPGASGIVSTARLRAAVHRLGMSWLPPPGLAHVKVTRFAGEAAREVSPGAVERTVREALVDEARDGAPAGDISLVLDAGGPAMTLDGGEPHSLSVTRIAVDPEDGRFDATIEVAQGEASDFYEISGGYEVAYDVPVLSAPLARGEVVTRDMVSSTRMRDPDAGIVLDAGEVIGLAARRSLRGGMPLKAGDLEPPRLVTRNQLVTVVFTMPGMVLTTQGRALGDAAEGETVPVLNVRSNRIVQAVVVGPGRVGVGTAADRVAMR